MPGCRKIYSNLLLLSVILFSLGSVGRPPMPEVVQAAACRWTAAEDHDGFRWQTAGFVLVYQSQHFCGPLAADQNLLAPDGAPEFASYGEQGRYRCWNLNAPIAFRGMAQTSRAPPETSSGQEQ